MVLEGAGERGGKSAVAATLPAAWFKELEAQSRKLVPSARALEEGTRRAGRGANASWNSGYGGCGGRRGGGESGSNGRYQS